MTAMVQPPHLVAENVGSYILSVFDGYELVNFVLGEWATMASINVIRQFEGVRFVSCKNQM